MEYDLADTGLIPAAQQVPDRDKPTSRAWQSLQWYMNSTSAS